MIYVNIGIQSTYIMNRPYQILNTTQHKMLEVQIRKAG